MAAEPSAARIPSLDGIRALAIWLTLYHHLTGRFHIAFDNPVLQGFSNAGDGVGIFFVLSGFLITKLLIREYERNGAIDLPGFFLRRAFRILPPLYVYLVFAIIFARVMTIAVHPESILSAVFLFRDYSPRETLFLTEHTWSLSVEEQFYLLWPPIFIVAMSRGGRSLTVRVGIALILATPVLRVLGNIAKIGLFHHHEVYMLHTRMDSLMCGCAVALLMGSPRFERAYERYSRVWWIAPLYTLLIAGMIAGIKHPFGASTVGVAYTVAVGFTVDSVLIAMFILWASRNPGSRVGRILNNPAVVWMGVLSYSAYLWQTAFIHERNPTFLARWPWMLLYIWGAAALSHFLVERPALACRRSIERRRAISAQQIWKGQRRRLWPFASARR